MVTKHPTDDDGNRHHEDGGPAGRAQAESNQQRQEQQQSTGGHPSGESQPVGLRIPRTDHQLHPDRGQDGGRKPRAEGAQSSGDTGSLCCLRICPGQLFRTSSVHLLVHHCDVEADRGARLEPVQPGAWIYLSETFAMA